MQSEPWHNMACGTWLCQWCFTNLKHCKHYYHSLAFPNRKHGWIVDVDVGGGMLVAGRRRIQQANESSWVILIVDEETSSVLTMKPNGRQGRDEKRVSHKHINDEPTSCSPHPHLFHHQSHYPNPLAESISLGCDVSLNSQSTLIPSCLDATQSVPLSYSHMRKDQTSHVMSRHRLKCNRHLTLCVEPLSRVSLLTHVIGMTRTWAW